MDSESPATPVVGKDNTPSETAPSGPCRSFPGKKNQGKVPKRVHKAEREKMKREHLNDLFLTLANALELSEQVNGKASILNEATRNVKDLLAQIEQLRRESATLLSESQYVSMEKKELQDENSVLEAKISKLQSEIKERTAESNLDLNLAPPECEQQVLPPDVTPDHLPLPASEPAFQKAQMVMNPVYVYPFDPNHQVYPVPGAPDCAPLSASTVSKPLARYPTPTDAWSSQILGNCPRSGKEIQGSGRNGSGFVGVGP